MWTSKIYRAKQLEKDLQNKLNSFFDSQPYKISTKSDPQSKRLIYYVTKAAKVPEEVALITGDIIQNLRSSLDHLAYKLFIVGTGNGSEGRHIYFPIADNFDQYERDKVKKTEGLDQNAKALIDTIKPYKEGNEILWKIHKLNNIDKHRLLVTVGSSFRSLDLGVRVIAYMREAFPDKNIPFLSAFFEPTDNLFPLKVGDELFSDTPEAKPVPNMQFKFDVVVNEPGITKGEPLIESIQSMITEVESLEPEFNSLII